MTHVFQRVLITGGSGFIGSSFVKAMNQASKIRQEQIDSWRTWFQREHAWQQVCESCRGEPAICKVLLMSGTDMRQSSGRRVFIDRLDRGYLALIRDGLQWLKLPERLKPSSTVFIKPNLTFPVFRKGVMTNPECVEALVIALKDHTDHIIIGEADSGGYNRFSIDDVQQKIGLKDLGKKYGIRVINLSRLPRREIRFAVGSREIIFPLPELLLDEADMVFSAAVPKIHMNTLVSMTVKNLWGCIPDPSIRLKLHPYLDGVLRETVRHLRTTVALIDGRYGLNRSGPMLGDPVELNWIMMADDLYAADALCCRLMQIDPQSVYYLRPVPAGQDLELSQDHLKFIGPRFYLQREWTDYPGLLCFRSPFLSYVATFRRWPGFCTSCSTCSEGRSTITIIPRKRP